MKARAFIAENEEDLHPEILSKYFSFVRNFYQEIVDNMVKQFPFKDKTLQALGFINPKRKEEVTTLEVVKLALRFRTVKKGEEEDTRAEEYSDYQLSDAGDLPSAEEGLDDFWQKMTEEKTAVGAPRFSLLSVTALAALALPHSNAAVERSFSMLRKIETDCRGSLSNGTVNSLMSVKMNIDSNCFDFKPSKKTLDAARMASKLYAERLSAK